MINKTMQAVALLPHFSGYDRLICWQPKMHKVKLINKYYFFEI